jgi:hypothetical protein
MTAKKNPGKGLQTFRGTSKINSLPQYNTLLNAFQVWLSTTAPLVNMPVLDNLGLLAILLLGEVLR